VPVKEKTVADDLYEKIAVVSSENRRLKSRLTQIWVKAIEGQGCGLAVGGGAVVWRDALAEIEALAK
jgi:hypothetical protein